MSEFNECDVCGENAADGREVLVLNRVVLDCKEGKAGVSDNVDAGDEEWHDSVGAGAAEQMGIATCWPMCTRMYVDGQFAALRVMIRNGQGENQ